MHACSALGDRKAGRSQSLVRFSSVCSGGRGSTTGHGRGRNADVTEADKRLFVGFSVAMLIMICITLRTIYGRWKKVQSAPVVELEV